MNRNKVYIYIKLYLLSFLHYIHQVWLLASKGKGLEISGTYSRKNSTVIMELTLTNNAMQAMSGFAIQLNKNRLVTMLLAFYSS